MIPPKHTKSIMKQVITIAISRKQAQPAPNNGQKEKRAQTQDSASRLPAISTKIRLIDNPNTKIRAEASVNIGGAYTVHGLKVVEGEKGMFMSMPSRSYTDSSGETKYAETFHPVTSEARQAIIKSVSQAYTQAVEMAQSQGEDVSESMSAPNME